MQVRYMQDVVLNLARFWGERGCFLAQPYDVEKGAGTMNPQTFFRVLGPEPWRVAYVEPSRRPVDGRYGENPNRLYQHHQYQVVLKPVPADVLDLYLASLSAIGLDASEHDVRFVEDNWESPSVGAWGLGWEVWVDGMEVTQFTYFQQMGGTELDPVSCEITYGLERLSSYVQGVDSVFDVRVSDGLTYGDIFRVAEREHAVYTFEQANVALLRQHFEEYEREAGRLADREIILPGYDYFLKCSHAFNILDAHGAISVTERAALILRLRNLARRFAQAYLKQREALGYPWLGEGVRP